MSNKYVHPVIICDNSGEPVSRNLGLTKREHFAGLIMAALITNRDPAMIGQISKLSVNAADALIEALK